MDKESGQGRMSSVLLMEHTSYLHIGTNMGNREENLLCAIDLLNDNEINIQKTSKIYETEAWGVSGQPSFLNQALEVTTCLSPIELLKVVNAIEDGMGRIRTERWGSRLIDIDILFYSNKFIDTKKLTIPHVQLQNRNFVLVPLLDIAPDIIHPVFKKSVKELYDDCKDECEVSLFSE